MPKHRAAKFVNPKAEEKTILSVAGSFFGGLTGKIEPAQVLFLEARGLPNLGSGAVLR
jgi:hypothetical protein